MKRIIVIVVLAMLTVITPLYAASAPKNLAYVDKNSQSYISIGVLKTYDGVKVAYTAAEKNSLLLAKIQLSRYTWAASMPM